MTTVYFLVKQRFDGDQTWGTQSAGCVISDPKKDQNLKKRYGSLVTKATPIYHIYIYI